MVKIKFKSKFMLAGLVIISLLLGGGAVLISKSQISQNPPEQVLSSQTSTQKSSGPILEIFSGEVKIKSQNQSGFMTAQNGQTVNIGEVIKTGVDGRAQILYPNHSVTRIDFNSQMTLEQFSDTPSQTKVQVNVGRIWSRVAKLFGKEDFSETKTDTLVASVRGTSYGLGILADGSNKISVSKSQVAVDCNANDFNALVQINNQLTTKCNNKLTAQAWGASEIDDEWFKWNADQDNQLDVRFGGSTYEDQATPTPKPTIKPTPKPTVKPTASPTQTPSPTATPTVAPTVSPTATPYTRPTIAPTPTVSPTPYYLYYNPPNFGPIFQPSPTPYIIY